jgi:hypothetical protein
VLTYEPRTTSSTSSAAYYSPQSPKPHQSYTPHNTRIFRSSISPSAAPFGRLVLNPKEPQEDYLGLVLLSCDSDSEIVVNLQVTFIEAINTASHSNAPLLALLFHWPLLSSISISAAKLCRPQGRWVGSVPARQIWTVV